LHRIFSGCSAHSSIQALAFRLATFIDKVSGAVHFRKTAASQQSGASCLTRNIWQRVIKERYKENIILATSLEVSRQRAGRVCAMVNIKRFSLTSIKVTTVFSVSSPSPFPSIV
jgi:hypothetical protein